MSKQRTPYREGIIHAEYAIDQRSEYGSRIGQCWDAGRRNLAMTGEELGWTREEHEEAQKGYHDRLRRAIGESESYAREKASQAAEALRSELDSEQDRRIEAASCVSAALNVADLFDDHRAKTELIIAESAISGRRYGHALWHLAIAHEILNPNK